MVSPFMVAYFRPCQCFTHKVNRILRGAHFSDDDNVNYFGIYYKVEMNKVSPIVGLDKTGGVDMVVFSDLNACSYFEVYSKHICFFCSL